MGTIYLNMKSVYGIETVDSVHREEFETAKEFRREVSRLVNEYHLAGMPVYKSQRCIKEWKQN